MAQLRKPVGGKFWNVAKFKDLAGGRPQKWRIREVQNDVEMEDGKLKPVMFLEENDQGIVLNDTRCDQLVDALGTTDLDAMKGLFIVVHIDPNVRYGTERTGGLALRAPTDGSNPRRDNVGTAKFEGGQGETDQHHQQTIQQEAADMAARGEVPDEDLPF